MGKKEEHAGYSASLREEELKNKVAKDWFPSFDTTRIIGNIDFCVELPATELALGYDSEPLLWAEAKAGTRHDIAASFVQLILTIGGGHIADKNLPPHFLGAFDAEKIAFLPYNAVLDVLGKNDFDWTVTPSVHDSKEFKELYALAKGVIEREKLLFRFREDDAALRRFIKANFKSGRRDISKILITKNNFTHIYQRWRETVMPFVDAPWDVLKKKYNIYDRDFYLAEMNIDDNGTADIADDKVAADFYIAFDAKSSTPYTIRRKNEDDLFASLSFGFKPGGLEAYAEFWRRYKRPPRKEYWDFIVNRLDLLVPQDVRERKGSFFTPKKWVELSQHYLELELGENWQDEYYVWDCCAGTGNLLAGLTNKYNIWASTLDQQDVDVMWERIKCGANLLESHVFQFDFLNDSFDKLPQGLKEIVEDPERRRKLVVYINPPYAEAGDAKQRSGTGQNKTDVAVSHATYNRYADKIGIAGRELFAQFLMRIHDEVPNCVVGQFSKLKHLMAPNFKAFRKVFRGKLGTSFVVPADTFDNVKGQFPIGFFVWRLNEELVFSETVVDVYDRKGEFFGRKAILSYDDKASINDWLIETRARGSAVNLGFLSARSHDVQHVLDIYFKTDKTLIKSARGSWITDSNLCEAAIYVAVCHVVAGNWLNDRDQFLYPNDSWQSDYEFQTDCLAYTLFSDFNVIKSSDGTNHWIPFTESEVGAKDCFKSHFMSDYLAGKVKAGKAAQGELALGEAKDTIKLSHAPLESLSTEAKAVMDAGRELWRYYHLQPNANPDASYYDIRLHFQGSVTDSKGKVRMNNDSSDEQYTELVGNLRSAMKKLARHIERKVYEYGFLR